MTSKEQITDIVYLRKGTRLIFSSNSRIRKFKKQATSFLRFSAQNWKDCHDYCYIITLLEPTEVLCYENEIVRFVLGDTNYEAKYMGRNKITKTEDYQKYGKYFRKLTLKDCRKKIA